MTRIKKSICHIAAFLSAAVMLITILSSGAMHYQKTAYAELSDTQLYFINQVGALVNDERAAQGLEPLKIYPLLCEAATERSIEIVELFDHQRPDGTMCYTVLDEYSISYYAFGENIASGYRTSEDVVDAWMNSPGHRANILSADFTHIGIGYYKTGNVAYWTQLFLTPVSDISDDYTPVYNNTTTTAVTTTVTTTPVTTTTTTTTTSDICNTGTTIPPQNYCDICQKSLAEGEGVRTPLGLFLCSGCVDAGMGGTTPPSQTSITTTPNHTSGTGSENTTVSSTTTTTAVTTTTTLYGLPTIIINSELAAFDAMYMADNTESLFDNCTFEIIVKKPISQYVYSNYHFDISSLISLDNVDEHTDNASGISPCDIYYCSNQSNAYSINYTIYGKTPTELAEIISENAQIDVEIIKQTMTGVIVDENFEYLPSVFGTFDTMIALRGDVDLNGVCDANDAKIISDYESEYSEALAKSLILSSEFIAPTLYENANDSQEISALRAFAANANCDSDENGTRIDNLDAAYIKMFDTQYNKICDELENNNQQLDKVYTTLFIWRNCGVLQ